MRAINFNQEQLEQIAELSVSGLSERAIASLMKVSKGRIHTALAAMKAPARDGSNGDEKLLMLAKESLKKKVVNTAGSIFDTATVYQASYEKLVALSVEHPSAVLRDKVMVQGEIRQLAAQAANARQSVFEQLLKEFMFATTEIIKQYDPTIQEIIFARFAERGLDEIAKQLLSLSEQRKE